MTSDPSRSVLRVYRLATNAADHLIATRRFDAAASILQNYLSAHPPYPGILRRLGKIRLSQGRPRDAVILFRAALRKYTVAKHERSREPVADPAQLAEANVND